MNAADRRAGVTVRGLVKTFTDAHGAEVRAVDEVDLTVPAGEFWVLLGPSGCGKTTLLRCLAGLEVPDGGRIDFGDPGPDSAGPAASTDRRERARGVGMVFQSYALWPHMTVEQNVGYPLASVGRRSREQKRRDRERVARLLEVMDLSIQARRKMSELSGGQQQRVALARALAVSGDIVLFDEPLSNIDAKVREHLRLELSTMQRELGFTAVYVTHDQGEAMELADRIAVMREGRVVQVGTPEEIYNAPVDEYVARFVGTSNIFSPSQARWAGEECTLEVPGLGTLTVPGGPALVGRPAEDLALWSRAHDWRLGAPDPVDQSGPAAQSYTWFGELKARHFMGSHVESVVQVDSHLIRVWGDSRGVAETVGDKVQVSLAPASLGLVGRDE